VWRQRPDLNDAEDAVAEEQRRAAERSDAIPMQQRIDHVPVRDILDGNRATLGYHAAGKVLAQLHGEDAFDLRAELLGRTCQDGLAALAEQQDGAGIDLERLGNTAEQLIEDIVEERRGNSDLGVLRRASWRTSASQLVGHDVAHIQVQY